MITKIKALEMVEGAVADLIGGAYHSKPDGTSEVLRNAEPFYGNMISRFRKVIVTEDYTGRFKSVTTAAVAPDNNEVVFIVNAEFFGGLSRLERVSIVKHECQHVLHKHLLERPDKKERPIHMLQNIGMDAVINQFNTDLPEGCIDYRNWEEDMGVTAVGDRPWAYYYDLIKKDADEKSEENGDGEPSDEEGDGDGSGSGEGDPSDGSGSGSATDGFGKVVDDHDFHGTAGKGEDDSNAEAIEGAIDKAITKTAEKVGYGNLPSEAKKVVDEILTGGKVNWRKVTRNFLKTSKKVSRKMSALKRSVCVKRVYPALKREPVPEFHVYTDMSGSVSDREATEFFTEILEINKTLKATVHLHQFDTVVHKSEKIEKRVPNIVRACSGGTNFDCVIDHARRNRVKNMIIMTDGYAPEVNIRGLNVLWVYTPDHKEHKGRGIVLELD